MPFVDDGGKKKKWKYLWSKLRGGPRRGGKDGKSARLTGRYFPGKVGSEKTKRFEVVQGAVKGGKYPLAVSKTAVTLTRYFKSVPGLRAKTFGRVRARTERGITWVRSSTLPPKQRKRKREEFHRGRSCGLLTSSSKQPRKI